MSEIVYIEDDLVSVTHLSLLNGVWVPGLKRSVLAWGDPVEVLEYIKTDDRIHRTRVRVHGRGGTPWLAEARGKLKTRSKSVLKFSMVDVQQGDGMVLETPEGKIVLIDGGDNKLFARYLAARYRGTSRSNPLEVEAMVVTHGDADHYAGLSEIVKSETHRTVRKRLFLHPKRVIHNGLVKGPSSLPPEKIFGRTVVKGTQSYVTDLEDDLLSLPEARLNRPFKGWVNTLRHWLARGPIEFKSIGFGDDEAFGFLNDEGISVKMMGPFRKRITVDGKYVKGLPLLRTPKKTVELHLENEMDETRRFSASHTINGHSLAMQLQVGNVRFFLTGDLNQESMKILRDKTTNKELESEIIKAPHHGSADFDFRALKAMAPVVSLISSGDESARKEHIHPRATLVGALGNVSRGKTPIILCTELAAFFEMRGMSRSDDGKRYFGFERTSFGIIQIRTDGERVLVFTHSGKENMKEAYRFSVDASHKITFENVKKG
ncbi:MBL fold metallo-hydrolase [Pelagicoccus sp. SDUM812002]|uniref:ComEC/Rec2 family competence protein n=1 Tax=Pelagicoccus sp. SDUM812002 TaxID=3041266 RepID=UPI00280EA57E|nr:MBL fold metallo-hydrolase [Pelagicoccus sp. SDUM812002]MDQ8185743.1 MBL fold metallo-hydrolase [Pelagicoccus sp. SDUM812002]